MLGIYTEQSLGTVQLGGNLCADYHRPGAPHFRFYRSHMCTPRGRIWPFSFLPCL